MKITAKKLSTLASDDYTRPGLDGLLDLGERVAACDGHLFLAADKACVCGEAPPASALTHVGAVQGFVSRALDSVVGVAVDGDALREFCGGRYRKRGDRCPNRCIAKRSGPSRLRILPNIDHEIRCDACNGYQHPGKGDGYVPTTRPGYVAGVYLDRNLLAKILAVFGRNVPALRLGRFDDGGCPVSAFATEDGRAVGVLAGLRPPKGGDEGAPIFTP